jgi:hypothetical protein
MTIDKVRAQIIGAIWQAVGKSGVDLSALPAAEQEKLISSIADKLMVTLDELMSEEAAPLAGTLAETGAKNSEGDEDILWSGRPFLSLVESYTITSERLKIVHGLLSRRVENYELIRIQDIDLKQGMGERIVNVGDIEIRGHDASEPEVVMRNVSKPEAVYEILRRAWMEARKRHGLQFREFM